MLNKEQKMIKEIIRDKDGNPVSVVLSYKEWLEIEQMRIEHLHKVHAPENPLDWYTLTETTNSILNELIAYTGRERIAELQKETPDQKRVDSLWELFKEIQGINRSVENFKDAWRMKEIIETYGPKLKKVNNGEQLI
ncbi:MAG: hypothetical protein REI96_21745 [Flavobacterium nitrogenifigens]|nr:hypothetical protein [Flavobacterium nitrogenifigens]